MYQNSLRLAFLKPKFEITLHKIGFFSPKKPHFFAIFPVWGIQIHDDYKENIICLSIVWNYLAKKIAYHNIRSQKTKLKNRMH